MSVAPPATRRGHEWVDAAGVAIPGPAPLASLGVGGRYVDPRTRKVMTITEIREVPGRRGVYTLVLARG